MGRKIKRDRDKNAGAKTGERERGADRDGQTH